MDTLLKADDFWKTYLADHSQSHYIIQPTAQKEYAPNISTIGSLDVEVKIKRELSPQPETVFLPCSFSDDNNLRQCVIKEEISCDSAGSNDVADFQSSLGSNVETGIEVEQPDRKLMRKYNKKIKLRVSCEYCDKGKCIFDHFIKFINSVNLYFQS